MGLKPAAATRKDAIGGDANAFQHRHYAFVAKVISGLPIDDGLRQDVAGEFATAFGANARFDRVRFLKACGMLK